MRVSAQTVGLQGRSGLLSKVSTEITILEKGLKKKKKLCCEAREGRKGKKGEKRGMVREEGHLVMICVY